MTRLVIILSLLIPAILGAQEVENSRWVLWTDSLAVCHEQAGENPWHTIAVCRHKYTDKEVGRYTVEGLPEPRVHEWTIGRDEIKRVELPDGTICIIYAPAGYASAMDCDWRER